jgi:hypothetical protein
LLFVLVQVWRVARSRAPLTPSESVGPKQEDEVDSLAGPMAGAPDRLLVRLE